MNNRTNCKVRSDGSVCLEDILNSFNSPIREEHAWALCYQFTKYFIECLSSRNRDCFVPKDIGDVYLRTDGSVHQNTTKSFNSARKILKSEQDITGELGIIIYNALNRGTETGEERVLGQDFEQLISDMIPDEYTILHETDEGIERDSEDNYEAGPSKVITQIRLDEVLRRCEAHLGSLTRAQVEVHYKAVVRAFVAEALELSTFLEKVAQGSLTLPSNSTFNPNLGQLSFTEWSMFWVQVMGELRRGVKLKKVNYSKAPIEYELTPYEILMKDIRNCRYSLRKIMVNGAIPSRVSKDAHAVILEFIRLRPPLRRASDRKLADQPRHLTPRDQLMNSIRKGRKLRPIPAPRTTLLAQKSKDSPSRDEPPKPARRLIKIDFSQFDDENDDDESRSESPEPGLWSSEYQEICDNTLDVYDLALQDVTKQPLRRNTLGVDLNVGCYSVPQSRPGSRQSCNSSEAESILEPEVAKQIQDELTDSRAWEESISLDNRLSLTLYEIVKIRTVLTRAELDALPNEGRIKHDVETGKVCFLCLKTRFGIFGPWGQTCRLCKRTICSKCHSKMNIPMEHFSTVPVVLLSPSIMATPESEPQESFPRSLVNKMMDSSSSPVSASCTPSPVNSRPGSSMDSSVISDPGSLGKFRTKAAAIGRAARVVDRIKANHDKPITVCHDCKRMVLQIIKSARANRSAIRNKTLQTLTLNLSPVF